MINTLDAQYGITYTVASEYLCLLVDDIKSGENDRIRI